MLTVAVPGWCKCSNCRIFFYTLYFQTFTLKTYISFIIRKNNNLILKGRRVFLKKERVRQSWALAQDLPAAGPGASSLAFLRLSFVSEKRK